MITKIVKLELENFLDINENIRKISDHDKNIKYTGYQDYPIREDKLLALIDKSPSADILQISTYYLKNLILLQPFADANHRTALASVELFLEKNGHGFSYTEEEIIEFQEDLYHLRFKIYKTYEQHDIDVLKEDENEVFNYCKKFIEDHLTKSD